MRADKIRRRNYRKHLHLFWVINEGLILYPQKKEGIKPLLDLAR